MFNCSFCTKFQEINLVFYIILPKLWKNIENIFIIPFRTFAFFHFSYHCVIILPVISIERPGGNFKQINNDNFTGGKLAANLLIRNGCEVFIHINNDYREDWPSFKRILGFEYEVRNLCYECFIENDFTDTYMPQARESMKRLVQHITTKYAGKKIGVFCSNDDIASLFEKQCIKQGIDIPNSIELIGYDNSPASNYAIRLITSIDQNISLMAQIAIQSLENYIPYESMVPATLIEKETTSHL